MFKAHGFPDTAVVQGGVLRFLAVPREDNFWDPIGSAEHPLRTGHNGTGPQFVNKGPSFAMSLQCVIVKGGGVQQEVLRGGCGSSTA